MTKLEERMDEPKRSADAEIINIQVRALELNSLSLRS